MVQKWAGSASDLQINISGLWCAYICECKPVTSHLLRADRCLHTFNSSQPNTFPAVILSSWPNIHVFSVRKYEKAAARHLWRWIISKETEGLDVKSQHAQSLSPSEGPLCTIESHPMLLKSSGSANVSIMYMGAFRNGEELNTKYFKLLNCIAHYTMIKLSLHKTGSNKAVHCRPMAYFQRILCWTATKVFMAVVYL